MHIVVLDRATLGADIVLKTPSFSHQWIEHAHTAREQTVEHLKGASIAITNKVIIDRACLEACPNLNYIAVAATGVNIIDLEACRDHGVHVANVTGYGTHAVAEHAFMLMLALSKQLKGYTQAIDHGKWQASQQFCFFMPHQPVNNLRGKILGLIGTGGIALATAHLAQAFGMKPLFYSPSGRKGVEGQSTLSLEQLLAQSDIVSIHCPLSDKTQNLIGRNALSQMKPNALLINTARGPIVDLDALLDALDDQQIAGAGLDVLPTEPPAIESRVMQALDRPNLIVTPHSAWASNESMQALVNQMMAKIEDYVAGRSVINLV